MASINYTYLYFDVKDYTNSTLLSSYTLANTPLRFYPDFSSSPLLSGVTSNTIISNKKVRWDFGDGTYSNNLTAEHRYTWPGVYRVILTVFDGNGNAYDSSYQPLVNIYDFVQDELEFKDFGKFVYDVPASRIIEPLIIQRKNSWQTYNALSAEGYTINLYASGAAGSFIDINSFFNDKWSHLRSLSRFYEIQKIGDLEQYTIVTALCTKDKKIFAKIINNQLQLCGENEEGSVFCGTTGYGEFYYVDDKTKNYTTRENPIFIFATLDNSKFKDDFSQRRELFNYIEYPPYGFQNIKAAVQPIIKVRHNSAGKLSITSNGIDGEGTLSATNFNIPFISWQNTEIPFVVKLKDKDGFTTKTYPPLYCGIAEPEYNGLSAFNVNLGLVQTISGIDYPLNTADFYSDFDPNIPRSIGGFFKGYFIPKESSLNVKLTAGMYLIDPVNFPKDSLVGWISEPQYNYMKKFFKISNYSGCLGTTTLKLGAKVDDVEVNEERNSLAIAVAPSGSGTFNDYQTWVADGVNDKLFKLDFAGNILSSFSLDSMPYISGGNLNLLSFVLSSAAPNSIALDGNSDLWVSLFDSASVIKIDGWSGKVKAIANLDYTNYVYFLSSDYSLPQLSGYAGENTILPSSLDTDTFNNVIVTYIHPVSNFIAKYDTNGTLINLTNLPPAFSPQTVTIDRNRNIWVTVLRQDYNNNYSTVLCSRNDYVYKFDEDLNIIPGYPISGFKMPGNITIDGFQNAYVFHNKETITKIHAISGTLTNYIAGSGQNKTNYICSIGGIACDTANYIWTINNFDNKMYFIDTYINNLTALSSVNPDYIDLEPPKNYDESLPVSAFEERSFLAYGDWIGSMWINKYMVPYTVVRYVTGESTPFNIFSDTGNYNISKVNEDFDSKTFYNDLRYQEILLDKNLFFDNFLGTIVGGISSQPYELGKTVYEKIANFVSNVSDIDKCNLDKLLSFCDELSIQFEQFNYPFPPQLRRLVDILSIKQKYLYGEQNKYNLSFNKFGSINPSIGKNLGTVISTVSGTVYSAVPIVAFEIFSGLYTLVNTVNIPGYSFNAPLPLSSYNYNWGWGLVAPKSVSGVDIKNYYKFYNYNNSIEGSFYNNIINWEDPLTLLSPTLSTYKEWSENSGIVQNILSYELTKGLKLFTSAANIQYNN
ncbi:PKD domain-containing protein [bacterium]|nr:PKD domain-containing protein [bacterium]